MPDTFLSPLPYRSIEASLIHGAFTRTIDLPKSNDAVLQKILCQHFIANKMHSVSDGMRKQWINGYKTWFTKDLTKIAIGEMSLLASAFPFNLLVKRSRGAERFDKDSFIKAIAEKYQISLYELDNIAKSCTKTSVEPLSFIVNFVNEADNEGEKP